MKHRSKPSVSPKEPSNQLANAPRNNLKIESRSALHWPALYRTSHRAKACQTSLRPPSFPKTDWEFNCFNLTAGDLKLLPPAFQSLLTWNVKNYHVPYHSWGKWLGWMLIELKRWKKDMFLTHLLGLTCTCMLRNACKCVYHNLLYYWNL